jgi:hypothetical protein
MVGPIHKRNGKITGGNMKPKHLDLFLFMFLFAGCLKILLALPGDTEIARWQGNKKGAHTLNFDDSMISHADVAIPAMDERGIQGTFYVNPGTWRWSERREFWEESANLTQEYANHTMRHEGAADYDEADYEIGETARIIWSLRPPGASRLQAFARGGATTWGISEEQMDELRDKHYCIQRSSTSMTDAGR